ncbi:hypothetical protein ACSVHC_23525 [Arthrobacter sp. KNU-44]|uniref:hypothetical protein n=1 Tax=Arthrobacter sp. KNU-44 TaxID=3450744 RepID=UPI003F42215D
MAIGKVARTPDDTMEALRVQIRLLVASCKAFDDGETIEALRIATSLRLLIHQTSNSHSLLGQVGLREKLYVLDSAGEVVPGLEAPTFGLTGVHMEVVGDHESFKNSYIPAFGNNLHRIQPDVRTQVHELINGRKAPRAPGMHQKIESWWDQTVVSVPSIGHHFSRKRLVCTTANQDGGAHVDPGLDEDYHALTKANSLGVHAGGNKDQVSLTWGSQDGRLADRPDVELTSPGSPVPACLRQIAWELLRSLEGQQPALWSEPNALIL